MTNPPPSEPFLTIAAVERDTGVAKDTLRVWERRYGFPNPERDAGGERVYPAEQVERLRLIRRLLDQGKRPSQVVPASREELESLLAANPRPSTTPGRQDGGHALLELVRLGRAMELRAALQQQLLKQGLQRFVADTVAPLSEAVGEAWFRGDVDVTEEHVYTEQVQNVVRAAVGTHTATGGTPRILLTTLPDERHALGLLMAEATLGPEGAACVSLGVQTPLADIRNAADAGRFDIVGLSFSAAYPLRAALQGLKELRAALPAEIEIWAGGSALRGRRKPALEGVRMIGDLDDALLALAEWRARHA